MNLRTHHPHGQHSGRLATPDNCPTVADRPAATAAAANIAEEDAVAIVELGAWAAAKKELAETR